MSAQIALVRLADLTFLTFSVIIRSFEHLSIEAPPGHPLVILEIV